MIHASWKHLSEDEINGRLADNLVFFYGEIAKYLHPNIKPWQEAILVHADRGYEHMELLQGSSLLP